MKIISSSVISLKFLIVCSAILVVAFSVISDNFKHTSDSGINKYYTTSDISFFSDSIDIKAALISADSLIVKDTLAKTQDSVDSRLKGLSKKSIDSLMRSDSLRADSLARLKHYKFGREDKYYAVFGEVQNNSFILPRPSSYITRTTELDSSGQYVIIREKLNGKDIKPPIRITIDEYIAFRLEKGERGLWEDIGYKYELRTGKKDLSEFFKDITQIEIPLPSNPILSIFGKPQISLKINGQVDIYGAWRSETTEGLTLSRLGNTRNEPDFKQQVQVSVNGMIGDKLEIAADWNTQRTFEYENMLKIKYTGYEDEIVQSIEAGNVTLQTSPLVGGSEALFGIKTKLQLGALSLTAIASQKKAETKEKTVANGSSEREFSIKTTEYSKNYYFVDSIYYDRSLNLFVNYFGKVVPEIRREFFINEIEVYINAKSEQSSEIFKANAFIDLPGRLGDTTFYADGLYRRDDLQSVAGMSVTGEFRKLQPNVDYAYFAETGILYFINGVQEQDVIAVAYRLDGPTSDPGDDILYGELESIFAGKDKRRVLKLVKPANLQPGFTKAWPLMLKNVYHLGARDISKEGFEMDIQLQVPGQDPINALGSEKFLKAFKLDINDEGNTGQSDGLFDYAEKRTIIAKTGDIIFPHLEPFGKDFPAELFSQDTSLIFNEIYTHLSIEASKNSQKNKWQFVGKFKGTSSNKIQIGFNVVENSVRVLLNNIELKEGLDYIVDYSMGMLTLKNPAAMAGGANLKISYEENDLVSLASKTLVGLRAEYDFSTKTKFGFSFLNLTHQTLSDKVRIGEEPISNTMMGLDFSTGMDLPFLTKMMNKLYSTGTMSTLSFSGEVAYMNPDPNTKKSTVKSDEGQSIAYIDDFEGVKKTIPINVGYTGWYDVSIPLKHPNPAFNSRIDSLKMSLKAKSHWFNRIPSIVTYTDIWGSRKDKGRKEQTVTVLDFVYEPSKRGSYNNKPDLSDKILNWGGMMTPLSQMANNLKAENMEFIEFWVKINTAGANAKMFIDLGLISEDVIPNRILDTEDKNNNLALDEGEDTGIDGIKDDVERILYGTEFADPNNDNFIYSTSNYENINNTEGNAELYRFPDTEDINRSRALDVFNDYFRYEVPLDDSNPFISGKGENGWFQVKIPLKKFSSTVGKPSLTLVETMRFWITGTDQPVHLTFAEMNLVGSQWEKIVDNKSVTEDDSVLTVSNINFEDNPDYYMPPGVNREEDKTQTEESILKNEQSMLLIIKDLMDGQKREVIKNMGRPLNVFNYRKMKMFVHGDLDSTKAGSLSKKDAAEVYLRFGNDTLNYYEYRKSIAPGWSEISIDFNDLTAIKQDPERKDPQKYFSSPVKGLPEERYGILGNPSLRNIDVFIIGIENPKNKGVLNQTVSGDVWVNELRVVQADDRKGHAYRLSAAIRVADLMDVSFSYNKQDPFFHRISDRFGSMQDSKTWSLAVGLDALKIIPADLPGSNFKVNYSHSESFINPVYLAGTDIEVSKAAEREPDKTKSEQIKTHAQTLSVSDMWNFSGIRINIPYNAWYFDYTINLLTFGFSYNQQVNRSSVVDYQKNWNWNANIAYSLNFARDNYFKPSDIPIIGSVFEIFKDYKDYRVYYSPQNLSMSLNAGRSRNYERRRNALGNPTITRDFRATRDLSFVWKLSEGGFLNPSINYNVTVNSTLAHFLTAEDNQTVENSGLKIWRAMLNNGIFGKDISYNQTFDFRTQPRIPTIWSLNRYFTLTAGYNNSYRWNNSLQAGNLGISTAWSNSISTGLTLKLKALTEPLFGTDTKKSTSSRRQSAREKREGDKDKLQDEQIPEESDSPGTLTLLGNNLLSGLKYILFDYEQISFTYSQTNGLTNSGLKNKGTGFSNFWSFYKAENGPSRMYMLGLSYNPGLRAQNGKLSDNVMKKNRIDFRTSRDIIQGLKVDLTWNVDWDFNTNYNITTDADGSVTIDNVNRSGNINRSFLSLPPSFIFSVFKNGVKKVHDLYDPEEPNQQDHMTEIFVEGFETLPMINKLPILKDVAKYVPRPNWTLTWSGLEKMGLFKGFAKSMSLTHGYSSNYREGWRIDAAGKRQVPVQSISYGFSPLIGMNITFNNLWGGNLSGNARFNTRNSFDLTNSTAKITESYTKDINVSATFSKSGFELPFFGLSLKNDISFTVGYTYSHQASTLYDLKDWKDDGDILNGNTRTIIEPNLKYTISSRVTINIFYKRTTYEPDGATTTPATTTNEAGLEVHISIQ